MKQLKRMMAVLCSAILLCSLMCVGAVADNGLEIVEGTDVIYTSVAGEIFLSCDVMPDGLYEEDLVWSVGDNTVLTLYADDWYVQAVKAGETTITVKSKNGKYSDTVQVVVEGPVPMTSNSTAVFLNSRYPTRTFAFTPDQTGYYEFNMANEESYIYGSVYDADLMYSDMLFDGGMVEMIAGEVYYLYLSSFMETSEANSFSLTYVGEVEEEPVEATAICFEKESITMAVGDVIIYPAYHFEPENSWYTAVTYTVDDDTLLLNDEEMGTLSALAPGTATVTVTSDSGFSDTLTVVIQEGVRVLTMEAPITIDAYFGDMYYADFTAPEAGYYSFYSVSNAADSYPFCTVYSAEDEKLAEAIGENGFDFRAQVLLEKGQTVTLELSMFGYGEFKVYAARPVAATGVELMLPESMILSQNGDTVYVSPDCDVSPAVQFIGEPNLYAEKYELTAVSEDAVADEEGYYFLKAGQSVTFTVVTENGLTDTVTVKAIKWIKGDVNFDGEVGVADVAMLVQYLNGGTDFTAQQCGAMELNGDNRVTLLDAVRAFYFVNGQLETL